MVTVEISPEDVIEGDRIVAIGERTVARGIAVANRVAPCVVQWRSHVHIEGGCYDTRVPVTVQRGV
jgi:hypothetical protein